MMSLVRTARPIRLWAEGAGREEDGPGAWRRDSGRPSMPQLKRRMDLLALFKADSASVGLECSLKF